VKQAYISVVLLNQDDYATAAEIERIDSLLAHETRKHELILVTKSQIKEFKFEYLPLTGPLTVVSVESLASKNELAFAGLGRSVGDFILEWSLPASQLVSDTLQGLLAHSDVGAEIVEGLASKNSISTRLFYKITNRLRPKNQPVRRSLARLYYRRALNWVLQANRYESHILVLVAEIPFKRSIQVLPINADEKRTLSDRMQEGLVLLTKGSRFGTVIPLLLAGVSSLFAIGVAIYALGVYLLSGNVAEGWTSTAVFTGLGQGAILALMGLVWTRLDSLAKGLSRKNDATADVEVFPAKR
jgi:hypothetical protein